MEEKSKQKAAPLFYIFKELKHRKRQPIFQNRKFRCPFTQCCKYYSHKNKMLAHLRTHYGIKPFSCDYCSKCFNEKGNLKTHLRIHTGERPYHCTQCPKSFKAFGQLRDHLTSHTGIKPFQCPICLKFYRRKGILKNHMLIHSHSPKPTQNNQLPETVHSCIYCCFKAADSNTLNQHIMSHLTSCVDGDQCTSGESTSQYSNSFFNENTQNSSSCNDMFTMLQKDIENNEKIAWDSLNPKYSSNNNLFCLDINNGYITADYYVGFPKSELLID